MIYELYPQSFQDSDGDGVGDLKGITSRLDYLHDLGIGAIWITPIYPSPGVDNGYDIADYTALDPRYGTMEDFDNLVAEAKKRDIRVIMDYVINHTSDQHPWFKESRSSRTNPKRDWYVWRDGKGQTATDKGQPPNNWQSWFGHSAWQWDETTRQYYYHYFYVQQPDLNWRNPEVHTAMMGVLDFWMKKGVAGFRIDAVSRLFEDPEMRDDPYMPGMNVYGDRNIKHKYTDDLPEVHDVLKEVRRTVSKYPGDPVLVTEADEPNVEALTKMYGNDDEVQLPMDFQIADVNEMSAPKFRKTVRRDREQQRAWAAGVFLLQSRSAAAVGSLRRRRRAQRPDRQAHGGAGAVHAGHAADVLRRGTGDADHRSGAHRRRARSHREAGLAEGEGPRRRAHAHAVGCDGECGLHHRESVAAGAAQREDLQRGDGEQGSQFDFQRVQEAAGAAEDE